MQQKKLIQNLTNFIKNEKYFHYFIIFVFSFFINLFYGYRGIFPIDSFLIYESGYKVLNGYHPFKDYWAITGPLLDYIQFIFFYLFDVNWFSYVLHSSMVNVFLATFIYYFLYQLGLHHILALTYSMGVGLLAYPSSGTPFMDHHAVIFCLISICLLTLAITREKNIYWFLFPIFLVLSFFSKQIPSAYTSFVILLIVLSYFFVATKNIFPIILSIFTGSALIVFSCFLIFFLNEIPFNNFFVQYILYPSSLGSERVLSLNLDLKNTFGQFKFILFSLLPLGLSSLIIIFKKSKKNDEKKDFLILSLFLITALVFIYCQLLTKNQVLIFFLVPFYLGVSNYFLKKYYNNKFVIYLLIAVFIFSTTKYHFRFNQNKKFMELAGVDFGYSIDAKLLDKKFEGLKWITMEYPNNPTDEITFLKEINLILKSDNENKIIITDYQFLSSLIDNSKTSPNKWYDDLSVPSLKNEFFKNYKNFYFKRLKEQNITHVYVVEKSKRKFIDILFKDQNCLKETDLNNKLIKFKIDNCIF